MVVKLQKWRAQYGWMSLARRMRLRVIRMDKALASLFAYLCLPKKQPAPCLATRNVEPMAK